MIGVSQDGCAYPPSSNCHANLGYLDTWGFSDVEAAIAAIPDWIKSNQWNEIGVDTNKWFVSGHSNGGMSA
jgi:alpha-beta hydrolase superfamily lysophospholipase